MNIKNIFYSNEESRLRLVWRILLTTSVAITCTVFIYLLLSLIISDVNLASQTALAISVLFSIWLAARFIDKRPFSDFGLSLSLQWGKDCLAGCAIAALAMGIIFAILFGMDWVVITEISSSANQSLIGGLIVVFITMVGVSVWEEAYFRSYLIPNLKESLNTSYITSNNATLGAVIISSVLFGLGHSANPSASAISTLNIFIAGLVLAYPYILTGSLALSVGIHLAWNYFQGAVFGLYVSGTALDHSIIHSTVTGPEAFTGGDFGPEAGAAGLLGLMILVTLTEVYVTLFRKK